MTPDHHNTEHENVNPSAEEITNGTEQNPHTEDVKSESILQEQDAPVKDSGPQITEPETDHTSSEVAATPDTTADAATTEPADDAGKHEDDADAEHHSLEEELKGLSLPQLFDRMEKIINSKNAGAEYRMFNLLRDEASRHITDETEEKKQEFTDAGNPAEDFSYEHPSKAKLSGLLSIYKEKHDEYHKAQELEHSKNLEERQSIIERLKNLYTNSEAGTNFFREIREIKEAWTHAGQVAKAEFKLLNNNYFHHLNQFYQMLDMNKEYLEQEYSHNLEKREHIIARARELENEPSVQKALNELQYLHKLWREEAEPVAEEFREKTWQEFREISNKIHERKAELNAQIEAEQAVNLEKKNTIIEEIKKLTTPDKDPNHNYWQNAIKKVEELRLDFLKTGSVPRKISNQNWNEFKQILKAFNNKKNEFYKGLKNSHQHNLEEKMKLIATAKDNMLSEDWETAVPLFKKMQEDWKKIGHVPRSMTNKIWDEFREACNTFFNNYRQKNDVATDNWKENYKQKRALLDELNQVTDEAGSVEKIEQIKTAWNNIGKVPRDKISINSEFNKSLREKMKLNKIHDYELKEEGLSEDQITDKARKIKNQISDLEAEIVKLENNLGFFHNPTRENPLLKDTYTTIDDKKAQLDAMKQSLHKIIAGE
ncbi:DUF349 domain-containing protein [Chryseobacterium sp. MFBS3-17]|uniref:DUF349 domain-containing protein n=1 Tax=Chryseobacterium sp. MFBS3-17 TaxID=2886689 RepID=UPI001D0E5510|nr:DUF349 domain-containing protein [Chryseobacterium sp. MFBS3-17]MCC2590976.1 DUF349 domain-containing protein [Chryseobacterium sp. MFBS3-17]